MSQDISEMSMHKYVPQRFSKAPSHCQLLKESSPLKLRYFAFQWTPTLIEAPSSKMKQSCCCSILPAHLRPDFQACLTLKHENVINAVCVTHLSVNFLFSRQQRRLLLLKLMVCQQIKVLQWQSVTSSKQLSGIILFSNISDWRS